MAILSSRQFVVPSPSGRAAAAHLGQALQPRPLSLSSRAAAGQSGMGRRYTVSSDAASLPFPLAQTESYAGGSAGNGPDVFMPTSFWKSQNPDGKQGWNKCANTVYAMLDAYYDGLSSSGGYRNPANRYDLVLEQRDVSNPSAPASYQYMAAPEERAKQGMKLLNDYMSSGNPVMAGVSHTLNHRINNGTIDHFVVLVGTGTDGQGKYYRFFDVGTVDKGRGTDPSNKLYYNKIGKYAGFYTGRSKATGKEYVLTQVRFNY